MAKMGKIRQALGRRRAADLEQKQQAELRSRRERRREFLRRKRMVEAYRQRKRWMKEKEAAEEVAKRYSCSPPLVRHYDRLWRTQGLEALMPRSRAPQHPRRHLTMDLTGLIVAIRLLTGWGAQRIARNLDKQSQGQVKVSHTTVWRIIRRHHLPRRVNHPRGKRDGIAYRRYQRTSRNSLWHVDYKTTTLLIPGVAVSILVVIDDATRYALAVRVHLGRPDSEWVIGVLLECFQRYGRPKHILTDNDPVFIGHRDWRQPRCGQPLSRFEQAIAPTVLLTTSAYYPQCNGKAEAFIRTMLVECLLLERADRGLGGFTDIDEIQAVLDEFITYYNFYRDHSSLGYQPPASRYLGKSYAACGFAAVPRLKRLPMPFPRSVEPPGDLSPYEIQRCFAIVPIE